MIIKFLDYKEMEDWLKRTKEKNVYVEWDNSTVYVGRDADNKRREILKEGK